MATFANSHHEQQTLSTTASVLQSAKDKLRNRLRRHHRDDTRLAKIELQI